MITLRPRPARLDRVLPVATHVVIDGRGVRIVRHVVYIDPLAEGILVISAQRRDVRAGYSEVLVVLVRRRVILRAFLGVDGWLLGWHYFGGTTIFVPGFILAFGSRCFGFASAIFFHCVASPYIACAAVLSVSPSFVT